MIDRKSRQDLLTAIDDYLTGKINTFAFDERSLDVQTKDETVQRIAHLAWFHYDDIIDHPVKLTRPQWSFFQRLRLIAQSDAEIKSSRTWNFTIFHALTLIALTCTALIACNYGIGYPFFAANALLGLLLFVPAYRNQYHRPQSPPSPIPAAELYPFPDFASMRRVYESVSSFQKMPYPRTMDLKPLRSKSAVRLMTVPWFLIWPVAWPLIGLAMLLSVRKARYTVILPAE